MSVRTMRLLAAAAATGSLALASTVATSPAIADSTRSAPRPDYTLTILHNNDGESVLLPRVINGVEYGGIARFVSKVDQLESAAVRGRAPAGQARQRGAVVLNSGDNFLAGLPFQASRQPGAPFYDAEAVKAIDYDVLAIGNHEFDFGPEVFGEFVDGVGRANFVSANLDFSGEPVLADKVGRELLRSEIIRERGERIGIVGLTTPTLPQISSPGGVVVDPDLVTAAQTEIDRLTHRGVDKIILVSHLQGLSSELALIPQLSGIDVVIGGGGGELLADPAQGDQLVPGDETTVFGSYPLVATNADGVRVPVVTTEGNYKYVGRLVVDFDRDGEVLGWDEGLSGPQIVTSSGPAAVGEDRRVRRNIQDPVAAYVAGATANVLAQTQVDLQCQRNDVRRAESNCGNLMADSMLAAATRLAPAFGVPVPQVGFQNGGGIRGEVDVLAGPFTEATAFQLAAFSTNFVSVATVPAETFRQILEEGAVGLPAAADGGFVQIAGARYTIDTNLPARQTVGSEQSVPGQRITSVVLDDGTVLVADGVAADVDVTIASNNFSLNGGDAYPVVPFTALGESYTQALITYVSQDLGGVISAADYPVAGEGRIVINGVPAP